MLVGLFWQVYFWILSDLTFLFRTPLKVGLYRIEFSGAYKKIKLGITCTNIARAVLSLAEFQRHLMGHFLSIENN